MKKKSAMFDELTFHELLSISATRPPPLVIRPWIFGVKTQGFTSETLKVCSFREILRELLGFLSGEIAKIFLKANRLEFHFNAASTPGAEHSAHNFALSMPSHVLPVFPLFSSFSWLRSCMMLPQYCIYFYWKSVFFFTSCTLRQPTNQIATLCCAKNHHLK